MDDWVDRLETWGRTGGAVAVIAALSLIGVAGAMFVWSITTVLAGASPWTVRGAQGAALVLAAVGLPLAFVGVRLLTQRQYPKASEVFPPKTVSELMSALADRESDLCVCSRCRVTVPSEFSTGSCPVCASSVEYHVVQSDEDAQMVIASIS